MPKGLNLKGFGRRKSSVNALDLPSPTEQQALNSSTSTFRVIERPEKKGVSYGAAPDRSSVSRPLFNSPLHALRGKSENDLSKGSARQRAGNWPAARGSGGTTNSGSSGYYDSSSASARHSSTSTLPSSVEHPEDEELFPKRTSVPTTLGMYQTVSDSAVDHAPLPEPPKFSARAARTFSFGRFGRASTDTRDAPPVPVHQTQTNGGSIRPSTSGKDSRRDRATTTSSYASTAVPTKPELDLGGGFGDDFSTMFDSMQKKEAPPPLPIAGSYHRTESEPMFPQRTLARNNMSNSPSPRLLPNRDDNVSPYSYDEPNSAGYSSASGLSSSNPSTAVDGIAQAFLGNPKTGYARVPDRYASPTDPVLERRSTESFSGGGFMADKGKAAEQEDYPNWQAQLDDNDRRMKKVQLHDPPATSNFSRPAPTTGSFSQRNTSYGQSSSGTVRGGFASPVSSAGDSWAAADSIHTTPRAAVRSGPAQNEASLFDASPSGPASRAVRPAMHADDTPKKMTKAQFQALQRRNESSTEQSEEEENVSSEDYDDDDDVERAKKLTAQRRKQEATMSVYRQQMKKVTGGGPTDLPSAASSVRPSNDRSSSSASGFYFGGISGTPPVDSVRGKQLGDEEDEIPLAVLQAHGFPSQGRPPTVGENDFNQRRMSAMPGGGGANLPAFARNLPADPYFGAGLVNPRPRESLAFNGAGSVYGMPTGPVSMQQQPMGHPGGLVGVIAGEEKARAARRGSPNTQAGNFPTVGNMGVGAPTPQMGRAMSMGNLAPPSVYTPSGIPPMPMMPQMGMPQMGQMPMTAGMDPQMAQFMQMQMQMMQNMLNMQQAQMGGPGQPQPPAQQGNEYFGGNRPLSMASHQSVPGAPQNQGRAMTMMHPPAGWNTSPGNSRPVSGMPQMGSYAPSVNGLQVNGGGPGAGYTPSIAPSERSNVGMPTRYRPVSQYGDPSGRTQSMTSVHTLQGFNRFTSQQMPPGPGTPYNANQIQTPKSTIRVIDKPKAGPRMSTVMTAPQDDEEDWAAMKQKREEKKKSRFTFGRGSKKQAAQEPSIGDLYPTNAD